MSGAAGLGAKMSRWSEHIATRQADGIDLSMLALPGFTVPDELYAQVVRLIRFASLSGALAAYLTVLEHGGEAGRQALMGFPEVTP